MVGNNGMGARVYRLDGPQGVGLELAEEEGHVWLRRIFGLWGGDIGRPWPAAEATGLLHLATDRGRVDPTCDLRLVQVREEGQTLTVEYAVECLELTVTISWTLCPETGVLSRQDKVENRGSKPATLLAYRARLPFGAGPWEVYTQSSHWCQESQGAWRAAGPGTLLVRNAGRTCQQAAPFVCLRPQAGQPGIAGHLVSQGNWQIRARRVAVMRDHPDALVLELGQGEEDLRWPIAPGEAWTAPQLLFASMPTGDPAEAAPAVARYAEAHLMRRSYPEPRVHYNTWFDHFEFLDLERCQALAEVAAEVGCEVFVVDAGWYGGESGPWYTQTGDWREATGRAFRGRLSELAEHVRAQGMDFGMWIEPERICSNVPARQAHPEWFLPSAGPRSDCYYPDLSHPEAYAWVREEIAGMIEAYDLRWVKVDCNHDCHTDPSGSEFGEYHAQWARLLDEIHARFPNVVLEGCASGGLRHDWGVASLFHTHFLSDTVDPIDMLRIGWGTRLRMSPGRINSWPVLTSAGKPLVSHGQPPGEERERMLAPTVAGWELAATYSLDFAVRAALPGSFGFSGNLLSFSAEARERLAWHVAFYKRWRRMIAASDAHLLTPPAPLSERTGWAGLQLAARDGAVSLVFLYHLHRSADRQAFPLRALDAQARYRITDVDHPEESREVSGAVLLEEGLQETLAPCSASVWVVERIEP